MAEIREIEEKLIDVIKCEFDKGVEYIDTDEMGKVIDMLKDVSDARYHYEISNAMEEDYANKFYTPSPLYRMRATYTPYHNREKKMYGDWDYRMTPEDYRRIEEMTDGRMYYTEFSADGSHPPVDDAYGKSWKMRKEYMDAQDANKMQMLEQYAHAISNDVTEMLGGMSDNERQMLRTKMQMLVQKI